MSELLTQAAETLGIPEALVERSAAARAAETGASVEDVLAAWAGGEGMPAGAPADEAPGEPEPETAEPAEPVADQPAEVETPQVPVTAPARPAEPVAPMRTPVPSEVTVAEAANLPEVVTVPTAGIRERTGFRIPRWLVAVLLIVPAVGLFVLGGSATGTCGNATELATDVVTGSIVNCDGSEFTGSGVGDGGTDFLALGERIYNGTAVTGVNCASCHGANGGGGVGPAMNAVITVFGSCADHAEWVQLGTPGFQAEGRSTYGDINKPVGGAGGVMPPHAGLSEEQLAAVAAFERVRFGGGDPDTVLADCGLVEAEEGPGEEGAEDSEPEAPGEEEPVEAATS